MVWFKVDDGFWSHPKVLELGDEAVALWVRAGSYCAAQLTDGVVSTRALRMLGADRDAATELVIAGLWDEHDKGWIFHDWAEYQPTREQVLAERAAAAERMRRVRANKGANVRSNEQGTLDRSSASPSRPVPTRDFYSPSESQSSSNRARVSTDAIEVLEITRRLAAQKGITSLRAVVDSIQKHTGLRVDAVGAFQVATSLLDRAKEHPKAPGRYVSSAIAQSPLEVQQFIHEHALEVA